MSGNEQGGWQPDAQKMGNWRSMFEAPRHGGTPPGASAPEPPPTAAAGLGEDAGNTPDPSVYRPWVLQRGGTRPSMMLDFRRYEHRSGLWSGWAIAYPYLVGLEYTGDRMLSLDFGKSHVMILGSGLDELVRHVQQGNVVAIQEYAAAIWPSRSGSPVVDSIRQVARDA